VRINGGRDGRVDSDLTKIEGGETQGSLSTQTTSSYIPGNKTHQSRAELQEMEKTKSQATRNGTEDSEMEWKMRPMLGAQRIYLQQDYVRLNGTLELEES
jgi:hypothetical protein